MSAPRPEGDPLTDEQLIEKLKKGDRTAGDAIVKRHHRLVAKAVYEVTNDLQVVEDLMQDIFSKAFNKVHLYQPEKGKFTSWLVTVARNEALNHLRKRRRTAHVSIEDTDPEGGFAPMESPSKQVSKKELSGKLLDGINSLKEPARTILKARILQGKSFDQIARDLKQPVDTIKTIFYRNTEALRTKSTE
jgi:RNA polymerase sigma-70 factor (ECF subfamily)